MRRCSWSWWPLLVAALLLSAAPAEEAEQFVHQGDNAFERGDWQRAIDFYTRAEERSIDPGLVAFNKAAALYRLGQFREAELHYLRCRDDATGERLGCVLYNLANSIVQQAQDRDARRLEEAIGDYEECLRGVDKASELAENAQFNLRLARALLVTAKTAKDRPDTENASPDETDTTPRDRSEDRRGANARHGSAEERGKLHGSAERAGDAKGDPHATAQTPPAGVGNLPVLPDTDDLVPLTAEDTMAYLEQVAARVLRERAEHQRRARVPPATSVKDW
jgi:tetratricopeptide (TPR) repeat protein